MAQHENEQLIQAMAEAFAADVAAGVLREKILAQFDGTNLVDIAERALCRAQDRFIIGRHERLHGPLGPAVAAR